MLDKTQIIEKLIYLYENAIPEVTEQSTLDDMKACCDAYGIQLCIFNAMARSIAKTSQEMLENYNLMSDLIDSYNDDGYPYWGLLPDMATNKSDLIEALEYRLFTLKQIQNETD